MVHQYVEKRQGMNNGVRLFAVALTALWVAGCAANDPAKPTLSRPLEGRNLIALLGDAGATQLSGPFVRAGLAALEGGDYIAAQDSFNRALKFDPTRSQLHFLNGLTYHLRAAAGDSSQLPYAAIGYRLALQYDAANYWAAYQLGHINFNDQLYRQAQDAFAYGLLFAPEEPALWKALATASYYAQDLKTAIEAVSRATELAPADAETLRLAALVSAAASRFDAAEGFLARYRAGEGSGAVQRAKYVARRLDDWRRFHAQNGGVVLAQASEPVTSDVFGADVGTSGVAADAASDKNATEPEAEGSDRMVLVDVVIIRSEERRATNKGVNLLNGLAATLGGNISFSDTRTINRGAANTRETVFTYAPTLSLAADYSLNIFNDNNDRNEILARPSLVALDGQPSDFFTGAVFYVEMPGGANVDGTILDVPVGIKLSVTPHFTGDKTVKLDVEAARAFIEGQTGLVNFNNFAQVTKTLVTANVAMEFGDTLVISGLSEKETQNLQNGVPLLQSIPIVQYLFSNQNTLDYTKSVLILLTPREPRYTYEDGSAKVDMTSPPDAAVAQPNLDELKNKPDWFRPAPNLDAVFHHLKDHRLYKEFRTGDVRLEHWDEPDGLYRQLSQAVEFLYY